MLKEETGGETLIDIENQNHQKMMAEKAVKISTVAQTIEDLLISEGMTWGEWGEVVELFSARIGQQVAITKVTPLNVCQKKTEKK